jgi:protein-disulfide isomerase
MSDPSVRTSRWLQALAVAVQIAFLVAVGVLVHVAFFRGQAQVPAKAQAQASRPSLKVPVEPLALNDVAWKGAGDAPVAVIEFADAQCPYCRKFVDQVLPAFDGKFIKSGQVRFGFMHLPLQIHPRAQAAATAMECAGRQGQFWPMHNRLFTDSSKLDEPSLLQYGRQLGLKPQDLASCMASGVPKVDADEELARKLGISGTPTFLVGAFLRDGRVKIDSIFAGAQSLEQFGEAIEKARVVGASGDQ